MAQDALVFGNVIDNVSGPYGISIRGSQNNVISNNLFINSNFSISGTSIPGSPNTLIEFGEGICEQDASHCPNGVIYVPATNNQIKNNIYYANTSDLFYFERTYFNLDNDSNTV